METKKLNFVITVDIQIYLLGRHMLGVQVLPSSYGRYIILDIYSF